ncbi:hypothetical protein LCGC14_0414490 [marine sediment metagenome]|uniref:Uncharacterized protein n=1 Tax=marine sediment metagenome TaxID=412755 RepID=A0A0F9SYM8_9ZZZZ
MITDEQVGKLVVDQARCKQRSEQIEQDLTVLGTEVKRMSLSYQSLEKSILEIANDDKEVLAALGVDIGDLLESVDGKENDDDKPGLKKRTKSLETQQGEDNKTRSLVKILAVIATVLLLPAGGWLGNNLWDHYKDQGVRLDEIGGKATATDAALERHEEQVGHEGLRVQVGATERSISSIDTTLEAIQTAQKQARRENHTAHERLEYQIRRSNR